MLEKKDGCPGFFVSALRGGSGKTLITIGITAALRALGKKTAPFKKGPDYIDAGWLSLAAGRPCYNLDTYLIPENQVIQSYVNNTLNAGIDIAVVEGNRGLYDGIDLDGKTSTAETAKLLGLPVFLCLDCTKTTRTMAAAVLGCLHFDPELTIGGVILNKVAGSRHRDNLASNIEYHTGVPVLGSVPKLRSHDFPERHMGLVPTHEHLWASVSIESAEKLVRENINLDQLLAIAHRETRSISQEVYPLEIVNPSSETHTIKGPRIGVIKDAAFQFYYPENIEALENEGAEIIYTSPLSHAEFPNVDALYIGGGFPETHAKELSENRVFRETIKALADKGFPIYAECGGLMYLGRELVIEGVNYPMTGIFPLSFGLSHKPQGHGYVVAEVSRENPYFDVGSEVKGHEFRYSKIISWDNDIETALTMKRGTGMADKKDGALYKNVFACYTHIHALGNPSWAKRFVNQARQYQLNTNP
ncbi:MAG: cobyrinate a,c-diamide synthase [Proteobacteria bacterium]|nr:cobyrinate a,c-diamide synthase [Pseudomonadota bacterium]